MVVFLHPKHLLFVIARKCGWIENDSVKRPALLGKALQPVKGVTFAKIMIGRIEIVGFKVLFGPIKIHLGKVQRGCDRSPKRGAHGKRTRVSKGVQHRFPGCRKLPHPLAVQALI